jgi:O-methyltransferase
MTTGPTTLYLELVKRVLTRSLFDEVLVPVSPDSRLKRSVLRPVQAILDRGRFVIARSVDLREAFAESPPERVHTAETMIGPVGLSNLQELIESVIDDDVPGDLIEAGAWRGGSAIFMRAALEAYRDERRVVWIADSFAGLPRRDSTNHAEDRQDPLEWADQAWLAVSLEEVQRNFERYGLLDRRVQFLVGWFNETLGDERIVELALMRVDGDMYGSTMDALRLLYPKLSVGGYVIIDDYWLPNCRAAVDAFRAAEGIEDELVQVDRAIVYWRRTA